MTKINNQVNSKAEVYTESRILRDEVIEKIDVDFLDKIKAIPYLTEDMCLSVQQVANYYECSNRAVEIIIQRNRDEFESDGVVTLKGEELKNLKEKLKVDERKDIRSLDYSRINSLTLITKRSLLRIGMIMTNCGLASKIRNYLLNLEECATQDQKSWAIQREVGIIERKRMTSAISKYIPDSPHKRFAYPNYTNMLYRALFNKDAKTMRIERNVKDNDALRDSFSKEELALVEEGETIITALIALGFTYEQVQENIRNKYMKQIESK